MDRDYPDPKRPKPLGIPMTGRARGRSRGRGRTQPLPPGAPGEGMDVPEQAAAQQPGVGRGRSRGKPTATQEPTPQTKTHQLEAAKVKQVAPQQSVPSKEQPVVSRFVEAVTRPEHVVDKQGTTGQPIKVIGNYVVLKKLPDAVIFQYHVDFNPPIDSKGLRKALLREHKELLGEVRAFDGMVLFLPKKIKVAMQKDDKEEVVSKLKDGTEVKITIRLTRELNIEDPSALQLINILFRRVQEKIGLKEVGRHFYNEGQKATIPVHKVEIWPGFTTSILEYEDNVMLNVDISHKVLRLNSVLDVLYDLAQGHPKDFHTAATRNLVGSIVMTRYNNKTYRIDDITWDKNPSNTFSTRDGEISFMAYYEKAYGKKIADKSQPLLVSNPKKRDVRRGMDGPILLIPELCTMTGITDNMRADFRIMKDVTLHTQVPPEKREDIILGLMNQIKKTKEANEILSNWNLEFEKGLLHVEGRILPTEKIHTKDKQFTYKLTEADWTRDLRGVRLIQPVDLNDFLVVFADRDKDKTMEFIRTLTKVCDPMGIRVAQPRLCNLPNDRTDTFIQNIKGNVTDRTQLVICVLPRNTKDRYDAIKKLCCVDKPVPSQCVVSRTLQKNIMSVSTKIAMQLNAKLGGELWAVEIPLKNIMVIGIDSYHDSAQKGRSVFAFVASLNSALTNYYSQCVFQSSGQELGVSLRVCFTGALKVYQNKNGSLPDRIVVYRDGVSEGQIQHVYDVEVPQILETFKVQPNYNPKFAFIVVTKRISTRFVAERGGNHVNPPPGSVVDKGFTKKRWYDFYLVSQSVRQGTVAPTHYNVILDTASLKPDHFQRLTYKLCHLYYNWSGTIRVPTPCQYAHKLAFLVGQSIHKEPDLKLADRLYFL